MPGKGSLTDGSSHQGDVLVLAESVSDQGVLCGLLDDVGYRPMAVRCMDSIGPDRPLSGALDRFVATVLCLRRPVAANDALHGTRLPDSLPPVLRSGRVIAVTNCTAEQTMVTLLYNGADHCFYLHESPVVLRERLNAALRHHGHSRQRLLQVDDISFDLDRRSVTRAGHVVKMSPKEFQLAVYLFTHRARIVNNRELLTSIWSLPVTMDTRRIDTAACRVRKKLQLVQGNGWYLKRIRGVGYRLIPPVG